MWGGEVLCVDAAIGAVQSVLGQFDNLVRNLGDVTNGFPRRIPLEELTDRELSILRALQGPLTQREIGGQLHLSMNTVKGYTKSLYRKLGVDSRGDAVAHARELGLI